MPTATTLLVACEKGGTGKSMLATNLAVMLQSAGLDTLLVDCDRTGSAHSFAQRRAGRDLAPAISSTRLSGAKIHGTLADFAGRYQALVIDTGGHDSVELRSALIAPCVSTQLIPVQASFADLEVLVQMDSLIDQARIINPALRGYCVLNRVKSESVVPESRAFVLEELPNLELAEELIRDRMAYNYGFAAGESVLEYEARAKSNGKASAELRALYAALLGRPYRAKVPARPSFRQGSPEPRRQGSRLKNG